MKCYWNFNTILMLFVYRVFLHGYTHGYVTALGSDAVEKGSEDPLSIPLISDKGAPLVAMLDTNTINRKIKSYIKSLMKNMIQNTLQGNILEFIKTSLEENSTIDLIRNITLQELNSVLKDQVKGIGTAKDCTELKTIGASSGVYQIFPAKTEGVMAFCDMDTDSGGWTIIQKRYDGSVNFQRSWTEYENGFGNANGEYWLGNKYIHRLTSSGTYELRIDLTDKNNNKYYAKYKTFIVGSASSQYKLTVGNYSGNAGDSLKNQNGMKFSAVDRDNDQSIIHVCGKLWGPWWHRKCCHSALNNSKRDKWYWHEIKGHYAKNTVMMIRKT